MNPMRAASAQSDADQRPPVPDGSTPSVADLRAMCEVIETRDPRVYGQTPLLAARQRLDLAKLMDPRLSAGSRLEGCCDDTDMIVLVARSIVASEHPDDRQRRERLTEEFEQRASELVFVRQIFQIFDVDRDGKLNQNECKKYLQAVGEWGAHAANFNFREERWVESGWPGFCQELGCTASYGISSLKFECELYGRAGGRVGWSLTVSKRKGRAMADLARCNRGCCEKLRDLCREKYGTAFSPGNSYGKPFQNICSPTNSLSCSRKGCTDPSDQFWCRIPAAVASFLCFAGAMVIVGAWMADTPENDDSDGSDGSKNFPLATQQVGQLYFLYGIPLLALSVCCTLETRCGNRDWEWHHHLIGLTSCVYTIGMVVLGVRAITGLTLAFEPYVPTPEPF